MFVDAPLVKEKKLLGTSLAVVNGDQLSRDVDAAVNEKVKEGYELVTMLPIHSSRVGMGGSFSYGMTTGVLLTFKK